MANANLNQPDLNEVATFARVVEAGSFSAAANALGVPKSTVSRRVARLEETLGVRLLQRTTRRMEPTEEGRSYYEQISHALAALREAALEITATRDEPQGTLRITAPVDYGNVVLAGLIGEFRTLFPRVCVEVDVTGRVVDLVKDGFDAAIRAGDLPESSLVARRLPAADMGLFAHPSYVERRGAPKTPYDLPGHSLLRFMPVGSNRAEKSWVLKHEESGEEANVPLTACLIANDFVFLRQAAIGGAGVVKMPAVIAAPSVARGELTRILPDWYGPGAPIHLVYPTAKHLPAKVKVFRDFLLEKLRR